MKLNNDNKKIILFASLSIVFITLIFIVSMMLVNSINENRLLNHDVENKLYGTVSEIGDNYIKIDPLKESDKDTIKIKTNTNFNIGDFILITYNEKNNDEITPENIETIAKSGELDLNTTTTTITNNSSTTKVTTSKTTKSNQEDVNKVVLTYLENKNTDIDTTTIKEDAKEVFIKIVDFIFYDGEINGVTWDSLSNKTKAKVLYYTLLIDSKIDNKWPNYKANLKDKYNDIKGKIIAKYMDITTSICQKNESDCAHLKEDFTLLKKSLSLTWDTIKSAFKYGYDKSSTYLKTWYEVFSGK